MLKFKERDVMDCGMLENNNDIRPLPVFLIDHSGEFIDSLNPKC